MLVIVQNLKPLKSSKGKKIKSFQAFKKCAHIVINYL